MDKCFCHLNGYAVKDAQARKDIEDLKESNIIINGELDELSESNRALISKIDGLYVNSVMAIKNLDGLKAGDVIKTLGYHTANDGGGGLYIIKERTNEHTEDNALLYFISDTLVAELVIEGPLNVKQFGATGDGVTDDTDAIQKALNYMRTYPRTEKDYRELYFPQGKYLVTDTLLINNGRYIKIYGKADIIATMNKPILSIVSSMYVYINDLLIEQLSTESEAECISIDTSYILEFNTTNIIGGSKAVHIVSGNNIIFNSCSLRKAKINVYTESCGNNTNNMFINCSIEGATEYAVYMGHRVSFYGLYIFENCYIEGNSPSLIYVKNRMNTQFKGCYINQLTSGNTIFTIDGSIPNMEVKSIGCRFNGNAYLVKQLSESIITGIQFDETNEYGDSNNLITPYNESDEYTPTISSIISKRIYVPNLSELKATDNNLDNWVKGSTNLQYTISDSIDAESVNSVDLSNSYLYLPVYLKANVLYEMEGLIKNEGAGSAGIQIYDEKLLSKKFEVSSNETQFTRKTKRFILKNDGFYNILLRNMSTTKASFCGVRLYSYEKEI